MCTAVSWTHGLVASSHVALRYGAVVFHNSSHLSIPQLDGETDDSTSSIKYGVMVNASAVHGGPVFMNLVNSAALQAIAAAREEEKGSANTGINDDDHDHDGDHGAQENGGKVQQRELPR